MRLSVPKAIAAGGALLLAAAFGYFLRGVLPGPAAQGSHRGAVVTPSSTAVGVPVGSPEVPLERRDSGPSPAATQSASPTLQQLPRSSRLKMVNIGLGHGEHHEGSDGGEGDR